MKTTGSRQWGKKGIFLFLLCTCCLITMSLSMVQNDVYHGTLKAAMDDTPKGVKVIDMKIIGHGQYLYLLSESGNVYLNSNVLRDKDNNVVSDVIQIAGRTGNISSEKAVIALRDDDTYYISGDNSYGQYGNGTTSAYSDVPILIDPNIKHIKSVELSFTTSFLVTENGDVSAAGDNT